jgi:hypothetical protein
MTSVCYVVRYLIPTYRRNWAKYVDKKWITSSGVDQTYNYNYGVLPNRLTPLYSKNHYKEENYLTIEIGFLYT